MRHAVYSHTQALWLLWLISLPITAGVGALLVAEKGAAAWPGVAVLVLVMAGALLVLGSLTVEVGEGRVAWRFGVFGWPRWKLPVEQIVGVEVTTSTLLEGWGINRTKTGMLYNAHGLQAVRLQLRDGRTLRLGSDEPERLAGFIAARLPPPTPARSPHRTRPS